MHVRQCVLCLCAQSSAYVCPAPGSPRVAHPLDALARRVNDDVGDVLLPRRQRRCAVLCTQKNLPPPCERPLSPPPPTAAPVDHAAVSLRRTLLRSAFAMRSGCWSSAASCSQFVSSSLFSWTDFATSLWSLPLRCLPLRSLRRAMHTGGGMGGGGGGGREREREKRKSDR